MVNLPLRLPPALNKYLPIWMSLERQAHWPVLAVWLVVLLLMPMQEPVARPHVWLIVACLGAAAILALLVTSSSCHWTPPFFRPDEGATMTRFLELGSAIAMFLLAALLLCLAGRPNMPPFIRWYSLALVLMAPGLTDLLLSKATGTLASWAARVRIAVAPSTCWPRSSVPGQGLVRK